MKGRCDWGAGVTAERLVECSSTDNRLISAPSTARMPNQLSSVPRAPALIDYSTFQSDAAVLFWVFFFSSPKTKQTPSPSCFPEPLLHALSQIQVKGVERVQASRSERC